MEGRLEKGLGGRVLLTIVIVVLIIIASIGYVLYLSKPTQQIIGYSTITSFSTVVTTSFKSIKLNSSGGFYEGEVITFIYTGPHLCTPSAVTFFPDKKTQSDITMGCEVGAADMSKYPSGALPLFVLVPVFAGLSIFGVPELGSSPEGFPKFNGELIFTHCGAGLTKAGCKNHMELLYSPAFEVVEKYLNLTNGYGGLPFGVLPTPAHSHLVNESTDKSVPWYLVIVLVFDPNIFPDALTGKCKVYVQSDLPNPTGNCLNSVDALKRAMTTSSSAVANANQNNPIWIALGKPNLQVVVPGISDPNKLLTSANSNMVLFFNAPKTYPYPSP